MLEFEEIFESCEARGHHAGYAIKSSESGRHRTSTSPEGDQQKKFGYQGRNSGGDCKCGGHPFIAVGRVLLGIGAWLSLVYYLCTLLHGSHQIGLVD